MKPYTDAQYAWLKINAPLADSYKELTQQFNATFHTQKSINAINQQLLKKLKIGINSKKKKECFLQSEKEWLKAHYNSFDTYEDIAKEFNTVFSRNKPVSSIQECCTKRLKLPGKSSRTQYKVGNKKEQLPIGTIRKNKNGSTYIKVKDSYLARSSGYQEPYWKPLQKKIYEDVYGEIPKGTMVIFLDGDKNNFDISNLYCIDRKISAVLASNSWYSTDRELTLTAIKWCELYYARKSQK